jgi:subtilase family serine protease
MRSISVPRPFLTFFVLLSFGVSAASTASAAIQNRITSAVSNSSRIAIPNSVHGKARLGTDLGPAAGDTKLEAMTIHFTMSDGQQAALNQLLLDLQDPGSPRYHQWLTPGQYAAQFGLSPADLAKVSAWLTSQGFTNTEIANSGTFIRFNGTIAQAQTAFATSIHSLSLDGETHFANVTDATVPSGLAGVVLGVTGLNNFKLKARVRSRTVSDPPHPLFTSSLTGSHYIAPGDFYTIYDVNPLLTTGTTGTGVTIAVMGQVDLSLTDVAAFRAAAGLPANLPAVQTYGADPGPPHCVNSCLPFPSDGDLEESSLDVEWAGAIAPSANILFVNGTDVFTAMTDAIDDPNFRAPIISISYGECETNPLGSDALALVPALQMANLRGITIIGPAGDDGATDCDNNVVSAVKGLAVDFPASSPYVTGMGGTMFTEGATTGATPYWNTNSSSSVNNAGSALSYIPEGVWNENVAGSEFSAGGGGVSVVFPKPVWQVGTGVPANNFRNVPDLSLNSAAAHDGYLYCVLASCTNGTFRDANSNLTEAGGTSFAAPTFAGILALIEQKLGSRIGNANPAIYALANSSNYVPGATFLTNSSVVFNDVTTGNNNSVCTIGSLNCPTGGSIGYTAGVGYDETTGWGTVNAANLASNWAAITPIVPIQGTAADFSLSPASTSVTVPTVTQTAVATFTVAPVNGFNGVISFAATSASTTGFTPTFSFSSTSVTTSGSTTLTMSFPTASLRMPGAAEPTLADRSVPWYAAGSGAAISGAAMAGMLFLFLPRRRRLGTLLLAALAVAFAAGATGCSSGNSTVSAPVVPPASAIGSYTVVVTATSTFPATTTPAGISIPGGTSSHAVTVNVVVQ